MTHLQAQLETYMAAYPKVRVIRAPERVGLIRARLLGAEYVKAPVITYLDRYTSYLVLSYLIIITSTATVSARRAGWSRFWTGSGGTRPTWCVR